MMKQEQGFTLIELLIVTAITGLIIGVLGTAVYHIVTIPEYGNDRITAMHELQNVAHWVSFDGRGASGASGGTELVLTLPDDSSITYSLAETVLYRTAGGSNMTIAQNIISANFSVENRIITMYLTSSPEGRDNVSGQGTYKVYLRPVEEGE